jgi:cytochrome bd-type quinol oxidase subunit 1
MDLSALLLSRLQFAFTVSFHIVFPSFTIGLGAWLTVLEALHQLTGRDVYRRVFDFWLKIFGVAFGMGVVSGVVLGFEFGTNWSELSRVSGPIQGPLLAYETFTAFMLEASFFGVLLFGRSRVRPGFYMFSTAMVALGTTLSAFWIMINNSWMQHPVGYAVVNGQFVPVDWMKIIFSPVVWVRFPHMRWCERWVGEVRGADGGSFGYGKDPMTRGRARCHPECMGTWPAVGRTRISEHGEWVVAHAAVHRAGRIRCRPCGRCRRPGNRAGTCQ